MKSEQDVSALFEELGIEVETREHPPVFTVEQSREMRGEIPGAHCKNLFLRDKKRNTWLLCCLEQERLTLRELRVPLRARSSVSFASSDLLWERLGVRPGSVSPFALINDAERTVQVVLSRRLADQPLVNFHPLRNDRTTTIRTEDLLKFLAHTGHPVSVIELPEPLADNTA